MCISRNWKNLQVIHHHNGNTLHLGATRDDNVFFSIPVELLHPIAVNGLENAVKRLETYRNCECPDNPDCHKLIDNKPNVILAK
jgi:hypothetical protein